MTVSKQQEVRRRGPLLPGRRDPGRLLIVTFSIWLSMPASSGNAYRFVALESVPSLFPTVAPPSIWHPEVWGPGETLPFVLVDSPGWAGLAEDIQNVQAEVEGAMQSWERIPSADIRWEIAEVVPDAAPSDLYYAHEHFISTAPGGTSRAFIEHERSSDGVWHRKKTWLFMGEERLSDPYHFRYAMLHELGHVIGLDHASVYSRGERPANIPDGLLASSWRFDPVMSYGRVGRFQYRDYASMLTPDDRVGASLLRPRDGWLETTGNIRGTVLLDGGAGAALVHVLATKVGEDGTLDGSVGAFTNMFGEFVIGGLEPGEYVLLVRALEIQRAHPNLLPWVDTGIRDTIWAVPVPVTAGQRAGPVTIRVHPGEERPTR